MLVLFDIDGTLVASDSAGRRSMEAAGRALFGAAFSCDGVSFLGSLDINLYDELCERHEVPEPRRRLEDFRSRYAEELRQSLTREEAIWQLPGAAALVDALAVIEGVTLGIVSGNFPETGWHKVTRAGFDADAFAVSAWGDDGEHRRELPPVALRRYADLTGEAIGAERVVVIGDTPRDVDCARFNGCRALAVGTGSSSLAELRAAGADRAVPDLSATPDLVRWILG